MFAHITLGTNDWTRAKPFYDAIMSVMEVNLFGEGEQGAAYGERTGPKIFIGPAYDGQRATYGNGTHIAFLAKSRDQVDAFYAAAMAHGGTDEGPPGLRPHYHSNYYGAYVRDPDGNKLQAVCHSAEDAT
ncbi:MAG: VOC family protein [Pseudomonadota bacterium]